MYLRIGVEHHREVTYSHHRVRGFLIDVTGAFKLSQSDIVVGEFAPQAADL